MSKKLKSTHGSALELMSRGRASYSSKSGIASLLAHIKTNGMPDTFDTSAQYRARKEVCRAETPYGNVVEEVPVVCSNGEPGTL